MSRVKNRDTDLEVLIRSELHKCGFRFSKNVRSLPGSPDIVFKSAKVAVFLDGDFWHGYRFNEWKNSLSEFWQKKIQINRDRDRRNFRKLRGMGWTVIRLWKHEIKSDPFKCIDKILSAI